MQKGVKALRQPHRSLAQGQNGLWRRPTLWAGSPFEPNAHQGVLEQCAGPARRQGFLGKSLFKEPLSSTTVRSPSQRHLYSPKQTVLRCLKAASGNPRATGQQAHVR